MSKLLSSKELKVIEERCEAATPGPWKWYIESDCEGGSEPSLGTESAEWVGCKHYCFGWPNDVETMRGERGTQRHEHLVYTGVLAAPFADRDKPDEQFIAASRTDIPALLEHIAAQNEDRKVLVGKIREMAGIIKAHNDKWGVRSGECNSCDLPVRELGRHQQDCQIPAIEKFLSDPTVVELMKEE